MAKFPPAGSEVKGRGSMGGYLVFIKNILSIHNVNHKLPLRLGMFKLSCWELGAEQGWRFFRDIDQSLQEPPSKSKPH